MSDTTHFRVLFQQAVLKLNEAGIPDATRDVTRLLAHVCGVPVATVLGGHVVLSRSQSTRFDELVQRRANREPLQYLLGECEFWGHLFQVTPDVLIPRPETEHVVEAALQRLPSRATIVDCCTGSGCIAISLGLAHPDASVLGTDISSPALRVATMNRNRLQALNVRFLQMDALSALQDQCADLITANPPYISPEDTDTLQAELRHEPDIALFSGDHGLALIRTLLADAPRVLKKGGCFIMEFGYNQGHAIQSLAAGDASREPASLEIVKDLSGVDRVGIFRFS